MQFVGPGNYVSLFGDPRTGEVFANTVSYIVGYLPLVYLGGLALALALNTALKGRSLLRGVYFLPVVTSWIVVAIVWRTMGCSLPNLTGPASTVRVLRRFTV